MKVQRKSYPKEVYEVLNESPTHYIIDRGCNDIALRKKDYEPVQEWVDVTHECTLEASAHGTYCIYRLGYTVNPSNTLHRVTCTGSTFKVEVLK